MYNENAPQKGNVQNITHFSVPLAKKNDATESEPTLPPSPSPPVTVLNITLDNTLFSVCH